MTTGIEEVDKGFKQLQRELNELGDAHIDVGIQGPQTSEPAGDGSDLTVAQLGEIHEFGLGRVPQRSFLREWTDDSKSEILDIIQSSVARGGLHSLNAQQVTETMALAFAGSVQERISRGIQPPNSAITIDRKGSSTPLIDTGNLRQSITGAATAPRKGVPRDVL